MHSPFRAPFVNGSPCAIGPLSVLSCLSVTLVYCGQTVGWIRMPLGTKVGLGSGHIVLDGDPAPLLRTGHSSPHFSAHVYCGQTVAHLSNCWDLVNKCSSVAKMADRLTTIDMGRKLGVVPPFWGEELGWLRGPAVEHWSLADVLSLSCARLVADGWPLMWVSHPL